MAKYQIHVGRPRENNAYSGFLVKGRNDIIQGEAKEVSIRVGVFGIPNGTEAWGIRLIKGKRPDRIVTVENEDYSGEIEWVKWGSLPDIASPIRCRYVPGYRTIDKDYQELRLRVEINDQDKYAAIIPLAHGEQEFDDQKDFALVQMLKVHHHNEHSIYHNPEAEGWMFKEIHQKEVDQKKTKAIDSKFDCYILVNNAAKDPESIKTLLDIVHCPELAKVNRENAQEIFDQLKIFADQYPEKFASRVHEYKRKVSDVFTKLESYNALDLTKDGFITAGQTKKELILSGIPEKGKDMITWAYNNFTNPNVYSGISKLEKIAEKLK